jgi:hypothetical protein
MALTLTANLTLISNADVTTGWSGNSGQQDTEVKVQGSASYTWQASKSSRTSCTFTPTTNLDMSATNTHLYWWAKNDVAPFMNVKTTGTSTTSGYHIRLTDGSSNYKEWHIAGSDTWGGEWRCFVLDVSSTDDVYASSGTLSLSDIDVITFYVDISSSGNIRIIDNQWNDVIRFGTGLTATGTDFDITDIAADDASSSNKYGILENIDGVIFCQGALQIGNGATTTTFNSTDETIIFRDRAATGRGIVKSGYYGITLTGSGLTTDIQGLVAKGAGTTDRTRFYFDASDTNIDNTVYASTFIRAGLIDFAAGDSITNNVFNNCFQIDPSTSTFQSNTISNYVGTEGGAVLFPSDDSNFKNLVFINNDNSIEYDASSDTSTPTLNNCIFDDVSGNYDIYNTSGSSVTLSLTNNSNANSYNSSGSSVTFQTSITLEMVVKDESNNVITGAYAFIDDDDQTPYIMNTTTDGSGVASTAYSGSSVSEARWRVRKYGYKPYKQLIDISSSSISIPVTLVADPQQI